MESIARREATGMNISLIRGGSGRVSKGGELSVKLIPCRHGSGAEDSCIRLVSTPFVRLACERSEFRSPPCRPQTPPHVREPTR